MKKIFLTLFILLYSALVAQTYNYNGLYIVLKNGKTIYCETKDAFYVQFLKADASGKVSLSAMTSTLFSPLITAEPEKIPTVSLSEISKLVVKGKNAGNFHMHIGTSWTNWRALKQYIPFNMKGYEKTPNNTWVAEGKDYGVNAFLIDESNSTRNEFKLKESTIQSLSGEDEIIKKLKTNNLDVIVFITYTVSGRHMDEGWLFRLK